MSLRLLTLYLLLLLAAPGASLLASEEAATSVGDDALAPYRELLSSPGTASRLQGLRKLMEERPEGTTALLEDYLWDSNKAFRRSVLHALVMVGDSEALVALDRVLTDPNPVLRAEAVRAITDWPGAEGRDRLRRAVSDPDTDVAVGALEGLTSRKEVGKGDLILPVLEREDEYVLRAAALALRETSYREAIPALTRVALLYPRLAATPSIDTIARLGGPEAVSALIELSDPGVLLFLRQAALRGLARTPGERATEYLLGVATLPESGLEPEPAAVRREAALALSAQVEFLPPRGTRVAALLDDPEPEIRQAVLRLLREIALPEATERVRALAGDPEGDAEERALALRVLVAFDTETAWKLAASLASEGDELEAKIQAVELLAELSAEPGPRGALLRLTASDDPAVSSLALESLRGRLEPGDVTAITAAAASEDPLVRATVCDLLGQAGSREAVPTLASLMGDAEPTVRQAAATSLGSLGGEAARQALAEHRMDPDAGVRSAVKQALSRLGSGS
jgi:HEAT repeat protein